MNEIRVRLAKAEDAPAFIDIHARAIRFLCKEDYSEEQLRAWIGDRKPHDIAMRINTRSYYVAEVSGNAAGYAGYQPHTGELLALFVDPDYARRGVASALMRRLFSDAHGQGHERMWLQSSLTAVSFYQKFGFVAVEENVHYFGDVPLQCLRMETWLKD